MAGIEEIIINDHYLILLGITLFFTVFTLAGNFSGHLKAFQYGIMSALTSFCWIITGVVHIAVSPIISPLFAVSYLYFGVGIVFAILLIADVLASISDQNSERTGRYNR